ncbi:MAG: thymidine phosphorylase, partial [Polyangiaceae bacterium]
ETREAIDVLRGGGPEDLIECTLALGSEMLVLGKVAGDLDSARSMLQSAIDTGAGARVFERMIEAQRGDPGVVEHPERLPTTEHQVAILADQEGVVAAIDALEIGLSSVAMGAGRTRADQAIDHAVGIELSCDVGEWVEVGQELALLHVHDPQAADAPAARVRAAMVIDPEAAKDDNSRSIVIDRVCAH